MECPTERHRNTQSMANMICLIKQFITERKQTNLSHLRSYRISSANCHTLFCSLLFDSALIYFIILSFH